MNTNTGVKKTGAKRGAKGNSLLTKLMRSKDVEYNIGTVHIKESLADALEVIKSNDERLFEMVLEEAFESINLVALADEYERKIKREKRSDNSGQNSSSDSDDNYSDNGNVYDTNSGIE